MMALGSHGVGIAIAVVAAALLAARAVPVLREVRGISERLREGDGSQKHEEGREEADRWRLRAARMELAVRAGCVALLAVSTAMATRVPS